MFIQTQQLALQIWCLSKVKTRPAGRIGDFGNFMIVFTKAHNYYPAYHKGADFPTEQSPYYGKFSS